MFLVKYSWSGICVLFACLDSLLDCNYILKTFLLNNCVFICVKGELNFYLNLSLNFKIHVTSKQLISHFQTLVTSKLTLLQNSFRGKNCIVEQVYKLCLQYDVILYKWKCCHSRVHNPISLASECIRTAGDCINCMCGPQPNSN